MHLYFNKISFIYKIVINNRISFSLSRIHIKITVKKKNKTLIRGSILKLEGK